MIHHWKDNKLYYSDRDVVRYRHGHIFWKSRSKIIFQNLQKITITM